VAKNDHLMRHYITLWMTIFTLGVAKAQDGKLPIIDIHMHAYDTLWSTTRECFPEPCERISNRVKSSDKILPETIRMMDKYNIVRALVSDVEIEDVIRWRNTDSRFMIAPMSIDPIPKYLKPIEDSIHLFRAIGEIISQYKGYSPAHPDMENTYKIAVKYDLPLQIHVAGFGGGPKYPIRKGNPMELSEVLQKYPELRVCVAHGGFPFGDEMIALMYNYPTVYTDISTINWIMPREIFHRYLKKLIDAGLGKRILFGSDQMIWPEAIEIAVEAIDTAEFLTEDQKRDMFYNNAARFLRLTDEQIKKDHE